MSEREWIVWHGGDCPVNIDNSVECIRRGGVVCPNVLAWSLIWKHLDADEDVVFYRDLGEPGSGKQPRYTDANGKDLIDEWAERYTPEEFRVIMWAQMEKYNRRLGKKDSVVNEVRKIADYANRWLAVEAGGKIP